MREATWLDLCLSRRKEHAMAVGMMLMSTQEIREVNKGPGVQTLHVLADGLWNLRSV